MKQIRTILALLLCLCMLPFSALAAAADNGTLKTETYKPLKSGLYIVDIMHNGSLLPTVFTGDEAPAPQVSVSVTAGATAAQEVDYNVYYLSAGTQYTIRAESDVDYIHDDQGEWALVIEPVEVQKLELNKTLAEGEWFSFAPEQDGDYTFFAAAQPAFLEIFAPGKQGGDWDGYANDKEMYRQGAANLANNYAQYEAAQQEYDQGKALVDSKRAEYEAAKAQYEQEQETYDKALKKLDAYQTILNAADERGFLDGSDYDAKKQFAYNAFKIGLRAGSLIGISVDTDIIDSLPERYTDLPAYLTDAIEENESIKTHFEAMQADAEAQLAEYEEAEKQLAEAETKLQAAKQQLTDGETQLAAAREKIQADADAIMSSASALAAGGAEGLALQKAAWLTEADDALTATLKAGTVYTVHILSGDPAAVRVTNDPEANPVVDKSKLEQAITDARANDTTLYTDESVAALRAALTDAEAVLADPGATQAEVDAAAKAVNDAVSALERIEDNPSAVDKSALKEAIAIAEVVDRDKYTDDSLSAMDQALNAAEAVNGNADATQAEVDAAAKALNDAIQALEEKEVTPPTPTVDKTALEKAIADAKAVDTDKYTDDSVAAMNKALADAEAVQAKENAAQAEVDAAAKALTDAVKALKEKPAGVDKSELQKAISEAEAIDRDKYTEDSLQALDAALITARFVNLFSSSQDRVDEVTQGLRDAIDALVEKEVTPPTPAVDKTALQKAITDAEAVDTSKYTDDSVAAMTKALNDAKTVNGNADATQADVDAAAQALNDAVKALKEKPVTPTVDKTALKEAIAIAEVVDRDKYTDDSLSAMDQALNAAEAVNGNADATQAEVDAAAKALNDAIQALKEKPVTPTVDKTALEKAIADAKAVDTDKYTDDSVAAMNKALSDAEAVKAKEDATQAEVDAAAKALNDAVKALKEKPAGVDKSELQKAISEAEAIDRDKYTEDSLQALDAALITARFVNLFSSNQDRVDEVTQGLRDAIDALVEKEVTPPTPAVDKTALQKAITDAEAVDTSKYTDDSVAAMTKALNDAKAVNGKADAAQAEVDAAAKALNDAVKALKEKENTSQGADKTELKKAIQAAEAIDRSKYTDDSVDQLDRVLSYAKSVDADKDASQARVTNAAALLNNAIDDLKEKSADPQQPDKCDGGANCPSKIFKDVNQKKWYHEAIDYAIVNKLFNGTSPNTFEPDTAMTRGMLVTVLYRMENEPGAKTTPAFTDLRQNWYKTAVAWAAENKIVNGIDATHFAPDAKVTREQAMTMLMRYAQFKGYDTSAREDLSAFKDAASVRSWALDAMQWGVSVGLIQGVGGGMLDPRGDSSRAQVATILMRFRENIAK